MQILPMLAIILAVGLVLPFYRIVQGPTVYDRLLAGSAVASKTFVLILIVGSLYGRIAMFIDIALAYALLNFIAGIVLAQYLERKV